MAAFAGHKGLRGLPGSGFLYRKKGVKLSPLIYGGAKNDSESLDMNTKTCDSVVYESGT